MCLRWEKQSGLGEPRTPWAIVGVVAGASCILLGAVLCLAYWCRPVEQQILADLASKDPTMVADAYVRPRWLNRVYEVLGIPRPVVYLSLHGNGIKDSDLTRLRSLQHLTSLTVYECAITDEGVKEIAKLRALESLHLFYCNAVTERSLLYVGTMKSLSSLSISADGVRITGRSISCLSCLPKLEILELCQCDGISDDAVEALTSLNHLAHLDIRGTSISEEGVSRVCCSLRNATVFADY